MSFFLRIWETQNDTTLLTEIKPEDIIDIQIDDNRSANDDPFEIIGRAARLIFPKNSRTAALLHLDPYNIPISSDVTNTSPLDVVVSYNKNFYRNLMQIIDDNTNAAIFTGLVGRESLDIDERTQTVSITIYDSLYVWITLAKSKKFYNNSGSLDKFHADEYVANPFYLPSIYPQDDALGLPLGQTSLDTSIITDVILPNQILPIPNGYRRAYQYDIPDPDLELDFGAADWCNLGQYSSVWVDTDSGYYVISYFTLFRSVGTANGVYQYKVKAQRTRYVYDSLIQPVSFVEFNLGVSQTITTWNGLTNLLKSLKIIPATIAYPTSESVTIYYGVNGQHSITTTRPVWQFQTVMTISTGTIRAADPVYGYTTADINIYPWLIYGDFSGNDSSASVLKSILSLWGIGVRAAAGGGLEFYAHLMRALGTGTPIAVSDADVIDFSSKGSFANAKKFGDSMSAFTFGEMISESKISYFNDFYENITTKFSIVLPRRYYDDNTLQPFMPITIMGVTMYLNQWSDPLYGDTFKIECFGRLT